MNDTRVMPARLRLRRPGGGEAEVLLLEPLGDDVWEALARPGRRLRPGTCSLRTRPAACPRDTARARWRARVGGWGRPGRPGRVELLERLGDGRWRVRLEGEPAGEAPLPPYIRRAARRPRALPDRVRAGVRAPPPRPPPASISRLSSWPGWTSPRVTLHVGLDTFRPVAGETLEEHRLHSERYRVAPEAWERIRAAGHVTAIGTTTTRVLETLARGGPLAGRTDLLIAPGHEFRRVDALVTNFHLPRSTLLALVMAFAGVEETRRLYRIAIEERYRFYSFGDAMLVL